MEIDSDLFNPSNMVPDSTEPIRAEPVTTEDEVDESERDGTFWAEPYPPSQHAGMACGKAPTAFQTIRNEQMKAGAGILGPFKDSGEWELAKWLVKNVGHNQMEEFLHLPTVSFALAFSDSLFPLIRESRPDPATS